MDTTRADGPLSSVRVVDLTSVIMRPFARHILANLGADLIKVEGPEGDSFRNYLPADVGQHGIWCSGSCGGEAPHPSRMVVSFAGDGCFVMNGQEFVTAVQYGLGIIVIVINYGMYGTIRMHQEREYPGHVVATGRVNLAFAGLASRVYGGFGLTVEPTDRGTCAGVRRCGPLRQARHSNPD